MQVYVETQAERKFCGKCGNPLTDIIHHTKYDPVTGARFDFIRKDCLKPYKFLGIFPRDKGCGASLREDLWFGCNLKIPQDTHTAEPADTGT